jgi:hypothetical protein
MSKTYSEQPTCPLAELVELLTYRSQRQLARKVWNQFRVMNVTDRDEGMLSNASQEALKLNTTHFARLS